MVSVSVCPVRALTFESLDLQIYFYCTETSSEQVGQGCISASWGKGQGHARAIKHIWSTFN